MKPKLLMFSTFVSTTLFVQNKVYVIQAANFTRVKFTDKFSLPCININYTVTIPTSFERCENPGRVKNFDIVAARTGKFCTNLSL